MKNYTSKLELLMLNNIDMSNIQIMSWAEQTAFYLSNHVIFLIAQADEMKIRKMYTFLMIGEH